MSDGLQMLPGSGRRLLGQTLPRPVRSIQSKREPGRSEVGRSPQKDGLTPNKADEGKRLQASGSCLPHSGGLGPEEAAADPPSRGGGTGSDDHKSRNRYTPSNACVRAWPRVIYSW